MIVQDGLTAPQPLDDPTEYIDYVKSFQSISLGPEGERREGAGSENGLSAVGSDTSRSVSPGDKEDKEWKVAKHYTHFNIGVIFYYLLNLWKV